MTTPEDAAQIIAEVGLPKMLARPLGLRTGSALNLRLLAFLLAPFNSSHSLTMALVKSLVRMLHGQPTRLN
ncbi:hypothetical protein GCM10027422_34750 [Hymenobacter arcticus]